MSVWLSGNALVSINVVALRRARLVPGWVTVSVYDQPPRSTQPGRLSVSRHNEYMQKLGSKQVHHAMH